MEKLKSFIVGSRLKEVAAEAGLRVAAGVTEAANEMVREELSRASARAKANGRKTIQPHDLVPPKN